MRKKVIGYGFKLRGETIEKALATYREGFCKTKKEVKEDILRGKQSQDIAYNRRPKIFKVIVEEV